MITKDGRFICDFFKSYFIICQRKWEAAFISSLSFFAYHCACLKRKIVFSELFIEYTLIVFKIYRKWNLTKLWKLIFLVSNILTILSRNIFKKHLVLIFKLKSTRSVTNQKFSWKFTDLRILCDRIKSYWALCSYFQRLQIENFEFLNVFFLISPDFQIFCSYLLLLQMSPFFFLIYFYISVMHWNPPKCLNHISKKSK